MAAISEDSFPELSPYEVDGPGTLPKGVAGKKCIQELLITVKKQTVLKTRRANSSGSKVRRLLNDCVIPSDQ